MVVVNTGSELIMSPFRLQVIDRGLSPLVTAHMSCAESPWFTGYSPNENGIIVGGSTIMITMDYQNNKEKNYLIQSNISSSNESIILHVKMNQ